jgi:hypothetical protein
MKIYIKNMVCQGTKLFVLLELEKLDFKYNSFKLGEIDFEEDLSLTEIEKLDHALSKYGLELTFTQSKLVSRIREAILDLVENNISLKTSFSHYLSQKVGYNFVYLNKYFRDETGLPIEEYYLEKSNEKMKSEEQKWSDVFNPLGKSA